MRVWAYDRGECKAMPNPFGEESLEESLSALDFDPRPMLTLGDEHGFNVVVCPTVEDIAGVNVDGFDDAHDVVGTDGPVDLLYPCPSFC